MVTLLIFLAALAIAALVAFFITRERRRRVTLLKTLEEPFQGSVQGGLLSLYFKGSHAGLPFEVRFSSDGENLYDRMKVALLKPAGYKLLVAPRGSKARVSALVRGLKGVESGDKAWDAAYYAASDDAQQASGFLASKACRESLPELFAMGYDNFYSAAGRIEISKCYWHEGDELKPELLIKAAGLLAAAVSGI